MPQAVADSKTTMVASAMVTVLYMHPLKAVWMSADCGLHALVCIVRGVVQLKQSSASGLIVSGGPSAGTRPAANDAAMLDELLHEGVLGRELPVMQDECALKLGRQCQLVVGRSKVCRRQAGDEGREGCAERF